MDAEGSGNSIDNANAHHVDCVGKVESIHCSNFVTYASITFHPSDNLNVIVAPNGCGKSTLIAALMLGLGGDPKVLSRASNEKDYIKNGKEKATIVIKLFSNKDGSQATHFQRSFDLHGKSKYFLDGRQVNNVQYLARVASFNVKIDNLCQFLPQERVQDFARMNQHELLLQTLWSVGSQKTVQDFEDLKSLRKKQLKNVDHHTALTKREREITVRLALLRRELESSSERRQYMEQVNLCKAKLSWLKTNLLQEKTRETYHDLSLAKKNLSTHAKQYADKMLIKKKLDKTGADMEKQIKIKADAVKKIDEEIDKITAQTEQSHDDVAKFLASCESKERHHSEYLAECKNVKILLMGLQQDLKNAQAECRSDNEREAKLSAIESELKELTKEIAMYLKYRSEINNRLDQDFSTEVQMLKQRLERLENSVAQKLMNLETKYPHVYATMQHVHDNIESFQGKVYDPIFLELAVSEPAYAKYLEDAIPMRDLLVFTCENKADVSQLSKWCVEKKLTVNVAYSAPAVSFDRDPNVRLSAIKKFGFTGYLMDLLQGPASIRVYLASLLNLHNIPYGTSEVVAHTNALPQSIRCFYGGERRYVLSTSRYTGNSLLMQNDIQPKQLLYTNNEGEIQTTRRRLNELVKQSDELRNERTAVEAKINEIEFQRSTVIQKRRTINYAALQVNEIMENIKRQQKRLAEFTERLADLPNAMATTASTVNKYYEEVFVLMRKKNELLAEHIEPSASIQLNKAKLTNFQRKNLKVQLDLEQAEKELNQAKTIVKNVEGILDDLKKKHHAMVLAAKALTCDFYPQDDKYPFKVPYEALPDEEESLREKMTDLMGRIDCLKDVNISAQDEYEKLTQEEEKLKTCLQESLKIGSTIDDELKAGYEAWYPVLQRTVGTINDHFTRYFIAMGYVGEIMIVSNDQYDFEKFGLKICVQFRADAPLQELDRYKQSGGERAVTIAAYTLSMQHVSHVPFRCVDEINQGMDSHNERKIFTMLLNETTQKGRSQYFFVTPKLLSDLPFNPNMTVHVIFNGTHLNEKTIMTPEC